MSKIICQNCNQFFESPHPNKLTCSENCQLAYNNRDVQAICQRCKQPFVRKANHHVKYCSPECKAKAYNRKQTSISKICENCKISFTVQTSKSKQRFCKQSCYQMYRALNWVKLHNHD
jgi:hypothetical protein